MLRESFGSPGEMRPEDVGWWAVTVVRTAAVLGAVVAVAGMLLLVLVPLFTGSLPMSAVTVVGLLGGGGVLWVYAQALCGRWLGHGGDATLLVAAQIAFLGAIAMAAGAVVLQGGLWPGVQILVLAAVLGVVEAILLRTARPTVSREWPSEAKPRPGDVQAGEFELAAVMLLRAIALAFAMVGAAVGLAMLWILVPALLLIDEGWNILNVFAGAIGLVCAAVWTFPHISVLQWLGTWGPRTKAVFIVGAVTLCGAVAIFADPSVGLEATMVLVVIGVVLEVLLALEVSRRRALRSV